MSGQIPADAMNALSRTLAAGVIMLAPGVAGYFADDYFGTTYLTLAGFVLGMIIGIAVLLAQARISDRQRRQRSRSSTSDDSSGNG